MFFFNVNLIFASLSVIANGTPVNVSPNTVGNIVSGVLAHIAALPVFGPTWLNGAITNGRKTNLTSTPEGFIPVAVATTESLWGTRATLPLSISYARDGRVSQNNTVTRIAIWADKDNFADDGISAIDLNTENAPAIPDNVNVFTRFFTCQTGDRLVPSQRAYIFIKTKGSVKSQVISDRITTADNRWTAAASGAFFVITCTFVKDEYNQMLPVRKETIDYSEPLPIPTINGTASIAAPTA